MRNATTLFVGVCGLVAGVCATAFYFGSPRTVGAASSDRYQDYVMVTGAVSINPRIQTDGVWLLDYRSGKLLGTVIDKNLGKIVGWAEVDLAEQFDVSPKADVHFIMTTGYVTQGQAALYIAETTSGKFGIYTMGPGTTGVGVSIRRHDMTSFRQVSNNAQAPANTPVNGVAPMGLPSIIPVIAPQAIPLPPGTAKSN